MKSLSIAQIGFSILIFIGAFQIAAATSNYRFGVATWCIAQAFQGMFAMLIDALRAPRRS